MEALQLNEFEREVIVLQWAPLNGLHFHKVICAATFIDVFKRSHPYFMSASPNYVSQVGPA